MDVAAQHTLMVVVVVVVIAQHLFSYRQFSRLRKSATMAGLSRFVSCIGWLCDATGDAGLVCRQ